MHPMLRSARHAGSSLSLAALLLLALPAYAQQSNEAKPTDETTKTDEKVVKLSPFKVSTDKDIGYKVTNATSGTRLNTPIKDLPMPISVISEKFLRDTGSTDLRQSLAYTAGIQLQSQNDQGTPGGAYQGPGGVNNPEGASANKTQTSYKIRGYVTDAVLRDGFRRQNSTDSINISRIEVAFGPTALLYGIGEFGGIVNYLPKAPQSKAATELGLVYGSYGFNRATLDTTGPLVNNVDYRFTAAVQSQNDYTDFKKERHNFFSPAITFRPTKTTQVDVDYETGYQTQSGVGFQRVRAMTGVSGGDQGEHADFYTLPGTNRRTVRWSGPDTYINTKATNFRAQIDQELFTPDLHLLVGYNKSESVVNSRDVGGNLVVNAGPTALRKTVNFGNPALSPGVGDSNLNVVNGAVDNVILRYGWSTNQSKVTHDQFRGELNYKYKMFQESNKWLKMDHSFLLGHTEEKQTNTYDISSTKGGSNYKSPLDASPIRFGTQGDGTADLLVAPNNDGYSYGWDQSTYLVYSGKLLDDRLNIVAGKRDDHSDNFAHSHSSVNNNQTDKRSSKAMERTNQLGASYQVTREISVFALKATGIQPNFSGTRDTSGNPIGPVLARSKEFGVKVDLFDGKLSGSFSSFKITRTGTPLGFWWAPRSNDLSFNPNKDIVYNVNNFSPSSVPGGSNGGNGAANSAIAQWNAGVAAGAIYQKTVGGSLNWYVNASKTTGAAYLDAVFDYTKAHGDSWPGWLYLGSNSDGEVNNAWDIANGEVNIGADQAKGWSTEFVWSPTKNFQLLANYAHIQKIITAAGRFTKYPYPQDRWAVWYFPNTDWGLTGKPLNVAYANPADTSTWTGIGYGSGEKQDDTPEHSVSTWADYQVTEGIAKGFTFGLGGTWESPREYQSGIAHGSGARITDKNGNILVLKTKSRLTVNALVKYAFKLDKHDASLQLNINNLLDDQKEYGLLFSAPRTIHLELDTKF